jgi:dienelactone hydrolase
VARGRTLIVADPFFVDDGNISAARELPEKAEEAVLFLYPGNQHIFADNSLPAYDAGAAALLLQRMSEFLAKLK